MWNTFFENKLHKHLMLKVDFFDISQHITLYSACLPRAFSLVFSQNVRFDRFKCK